ncbi:uncharacterized protein A1O5_07630 [Cladophialophora psammophila CBS 110553]|uniref:Uncharacterized protein n=1 Tax=Cladophialophora psammophila CBS 110553 TaxID=1182543 RepID=W9XGV5_9EURO|nr:uncharacterized protein A1O5_07630 [Cladophialophora psammophila CBS 110553]EXJ69594.1 hypothetical protein A1O5_07630 [Cladophialophora psammophila CBS 110553]
MAFPNALYGLAYPDLGSHTSLSNSIYLGMNANSGFLNASRNDQEYSSAANFPLAYGYNTLILSENSAALLDLPLLPPLLRFKGDWPGMRHGKYPPMSTPL